MRDHRDRIDRPGRVAIVDFGLGNLYSVAMACRRVGLDPVVTAERSVLDEADAVILPGVGAFGAAMASLHRSNLVEPLREIARAGERPLVGVCLGVQLLMRESHEFGSHEGLGLIDGDVVSLSSLAPAGAERLKVPHVGWNRIERRGEDPLLDGIPDGAYLYFVHSFVVRPSDPSVVTAVTRYEGIEFVSAVRRGNVHAFQFHPERSGHDGLTLYRNLARLVSPEGVSA